MTLVEFLRARLGEDEAVARACNSWSWREDGEHVGAIPSGLGDGGTLVVKDRRAPAADTDGWHLSKGERWWRVVSCSREHRSQKCSVRHIARHDPARVLAEVEAKRRIVELEEHDALGDVGRAIYGPLQSRILRHLATVYADHPDYLEEWRP